MGFACSNCRWLLGLLTMVWGLVAAACMVGQVSSSEPNLTFPAPEQVSRDVPEAQWQQAEKLLRLLNAGDYPAASRLFAPVLCEAFPTGEVQRIWELYLDRGGLFEGVLSYSMNDSANGRFLEIRASWQRAIMRIRLSFDAEERIDGFWLARDPVGPTPRYFQRHGCLYGLAAERIAGLDHEVQVRIADTGREAPEDDTVTLWLCMDTPDEIARHLGYSSVGAGSCISKCTFESSEDGTLRRWRRLPAGKYLVTIDSNESTGQSSTISDVFTLEEQHKSVLLPLQIPNGPALAVRVVDADSGEPVEEASVRLKLKEPNLSPQLSFQLRGAEGFHRMGGLLPGTYSLCVSKPSDHPDEPKYVGEPEESELELIAGEDREITVALKKTPLGEEELDRRWPWILDGTVTDPEGKPIEGAEVVAYAGVGRIALCGGTATTNEQGKYHLRYTRSVPYPNDPSRTPVVKGKFYVHKKGYSRQKPSCCANLHVADRTLSEEEREKFKIPQNEADRIAIPGKVKQIDFVMERERSIL